MTIEQKRRDALSSLPPGGQGLGLHNAMMSAVNYEIMSGRDDATILSDIQAAIPPGSRHVALNEITDTIATGRLTCYAPGQPRKQYTKSKPIPQIDGKALLDGILDRVGDYTLDNLEADSPVCNDRAPEHDATPFLQNNFDPDAYIYLGDRKQPGIVGKNIRTASQWCTAFENGAPIPPLICSNPLTGKSAMSKGLKPTFRGDANVARYDHAIVEFDNLPIETQIRFFAGSPLKIKALVDSGNKSVHAWVCLKDWGVTDYAGWCRLIKDELYEKYLVPLGADRTCSNPARLTRMPGSFRESSGRYQQILWMSPKGQTINGNSNRA